MNASVEDLRPTIVPKSDQLNAEQLLAGPMVLTITDVDVTSNPEQPVVVRYEDDNGRPFKPCKTMRKALIFAWGPNGLEWVGRSMRVFNDPAVKFGGTDVGGIRISHLSHIPRTLTLSLTATKGKKAAHTIEVLKVVTLDEVLAAIEKATNKASMGAAKALAEQLLSQSAISAAREAYAAKVQALKGATAPAPKPAAKTLADFKAEIEAATSAEVAQLVMDEAVSVLTSADELDELQAVWDAKWGGN